MRNRPLPSADDLLKIFEYDPLTGRMSWRVDAPRKPGTAGKIAGAVAKTDGYRRVTVRGRKMLAHRVAWKILYGKDPAADIDHKDGNRDNNSAGNLRQATRPENQRNRHANVGPCPKGVYLSKNGRFIAQIRESQSGGRYLGIFETSGEAHEVYVAAAKEAFGEYANAGRDSKFYETEGAFE